MYRRRSPIKHLITLVCLLLVGLAMSEPLAPAIGGRGRRLPIRSNCHSLGWYDPGCDRPISAQMYQTCEKFIMSFMGRAESNW